MTTLIKRLSEAIAARRALAEAIEHREWNPVEAEDGLMWHLDAPSGDPKCEAKIAESCGCCSIGTLTEAEARHIAANDPAAVLRQCDALLALLAVVNPTDPGVGVVIRVLAEAYGITEE